MKVLYALPLAFFPLIVSKFQVRSFLLPVLVMNLCLKTVATAAAEAGEIFYDFIPGLFNQSCFFTIPEADADLESNGIPSQDRDSSAMPAATEIFVAEARNISVAEARNRNPLILAEISPRFSRTSNRFRDPRNGGHLILAEIPEAAAIPHYYFCGSRVILAAVPIVESFVFLQRLIVDISHRCFYFWFSCDNEDNYCIVRCLMWIFIISNAITIGIFFLMQI